MSRTGDCVVASDPLLSGAATGCQLWVMCGLFATTLRMSAFGGKADVIQGVAECPLIAISRHKDRGSKSQSFLVTLCKKNKKTRKVNVVFQTLAGKV